MLEKCVLGLGEARHRPFLEPGEEKFGCLKGRLFSIALKRDFKNKGKEQLHEKPERQRIGQTDFPGFQGVPLHENQAIHGGAGYNTEQKDGCWQDSNPEYYKPGGHPPVSRYRDACLNINRPGGRRLVAA